MMEPGELARLDGWVRGGGRALILADPTDPEDDQGQHADAG